MYLGILLGVVYLLVSVLKVMFGCSVMILLFLFVLMDGLLFVLLVIYGSVDYVVVLDNGV